jgi:gluconate 5-dehydrogenase
VINIASHLGVVALPRRTIYCSSKAAVIHYTRTLAAEWAKDHITANCIAPGYTATELAQLVLQNESFRNEVLAKTPLGFIADVGDIAGAAVFLASSASRYMTGQTMVIDGGWSCV